MRVLVMPLQNKRGMSAFPESGRSGAMKTAEMKGRFRPKPDICRQVNPDNPLRFQRI